MHDAPKVRLGLNHGLNFHNKLQDVDRLVTGVIQSLDTEKQLDDIFLCNLLVVVKEDVVTDVGSNHVRVEDLDCGLAPLVKILKHLLVAVCCTLVTQSGLSIVDLHIAQDGEILRATIEKD